jgi:hypothetical protein
LIRKAGIGDEGAYRELLRRVLYNRKHGAYSVFPCGCNPPCQVPSDEQLEALDAKLNKDIEAVKPT